MRNGDFGTTEPQRPEPQKPENRYTLSAMNLERVAVHASPRTLLIDRNLLALVIPGSINDRTIIAL